MRIKKYFLILFSCAIAIWGCESAALEPDPNRLGFQFFPLVKNIEATYQVEEINYRNDGTVDTLRYFLQDEWVDSVVSNQELQLQGYRYRISTNNLKEIISTVEISRSPQIATVKIGNEKEVKLSFPVKEGLTWNGTPAANEVDEYTLFKVFQPYELNDSVFERTVQVIQENVQDSVINYDQRIEVYAADIGLIYKLSSQLEFCKQTECLGLQQIEFGKTTRMKRVL